MNGLRGRRTRVCVSSSHACTRLTVSNSKSCFPVYHQHIINENIPPRSKREGFRCHQVFVIKVAYFFCASHLAFYIIFPLNFNYEAFIDDPTVVNSSKNVVL